jgi:tetratricopeptide (TPR) repeat protein
MNSSIFDVYHSQVSDLMTLKPVLVDELRLETWHQGRYLLCRTIEESYKIHAVMSLVEDTAGRYAMLSLYNLAKSFDDNASVVLPVNSVLLIKEPYFKSTSNGAAMIRCDSISDIVFIDYLDENYQKFKVASIRNWGDILKSKDSVYAAPIPQSSEEWKNRGNALYQKRHLNDAVRAYSIGISQCNGNPDDSLLLTLNRSAAYLTLGRYEESAKDAIKVLEISPGNIKALSRVARSFYRLRLYDVALPYFEELAKLDVQNTGDLMACRKRISEKMAANYDWKELKSQAEAAPGNAIRFDVGDFFNSDLIEIRFISQQKDITPGALLSVEKAFQVSFSSEVQNLHLTQFHFKKSTAYDTNFVQIVTDIMHSFRENPLAASLAISGLYAGGPHQDTVHGADGLLNLMSYDRIRSVCFHNCFSADVEFTKKNRSLDAVDAPFEADQKEVVNSGGTGIWIRNSSFNHCCLSNSTYWFLGDVMVIVASNFIKAGEEITIMYVSPERNLIERQKVCRKFGFTCRCEICRMDAVFDEKSFNALKHRFYSKIAPRVRNLDSTVIPVLEKCLANMKSIYRQSCQTQFLFRITDIMGALALMYQAQNRFDEALKMHEEVFKCYSNIDNIEDFMDGKNFGKIVYLPHNLKLPVLQMIRGNEILGKRKEVQKWTKFLNLFNKITGIIIEF